MGEFFSIEYFFDISEVISMVKMNIKFEDPIYKWFMVALELEGKTVQKKAIAINANVSPSFVTDIFNYKTKASYEKRLAIIQGLGCEYLEFLERGKSLTEGRPTNEQISLPEPERLYTPALNPSQELNESNENEGDSNLNEIEKEYLQSLKDQISDLKGTVADFKNEKIELKAEIKEQKEELKQLRAEIREWQSSLYVANRRLEKTKGQQVQTPIVKTAANQ